METIIKDYGCNGFDFSILLKWNEKLKDLGAGKYCTFKMKGDVAIKFLRRFNLTDEEIVSKLYPKIYLQEGKILHKKRIIRSLEVFGFDTKKLNTRTTYDTLLLYIIDVINNTRFIAAANKVCERYNESNTYLEITIISHYIKQSEK